MLATAWPCQWLYRSECESAIAFLAARPLAWLAVALPFMLINYFSLIALIADKRTWQAAAAAFTAFSLNIIIDWTMIPRLGIGGAALGAVSAQAAVSVIAWFMLSPRFQGRRSH